MALDKKKKLKNTGQKYTQKSGVTFELETTRTHA